MSELNNRSVDGPANPRWKPAVPVVTHHAVCIVPNGHTQPCSRLAAEATAETGCKASCSPPATRKMPILLYGSSSCVADCSAAAPVPSSVECRATAKVGWASAMPLAPCRSIYAIVGSNRRTSGRTVACGTHSPESPRAHNLVGTAEEAAS
jgi:hypothetical protein